MRKTLLLCCTILLFHLADAQIEKGSIFTGGSVGFSKYKNDDLTSNLANSSAWNVAPQLGIGTGHNTIAGIQLLLNGNSNQNKYSVGNNIKNTYKNYGLGVFYRKYYPLNSKFLLFGQATLIGSRTIMNSYENDRQTARSKGFSAGLGITPGITYQAGKKIFLEMMLNDLLNVSYQRNKTDRLDGFNTVVNKEKSSNFSAGVNSNGFNNIYIGVRWIFPKA